MCTTPQDVADAYLPELLGPCEAVAAAAGRPGTARGSQSPGPRSGNKKITKNHSYSIHHVLRIRGSRVRSGALAALHSH